MSLQQEPDHVVAGIAKTVDGSPVVEQAKFEYVIGADGGHSMSALYLYM